MIIGQARHVGLREDESLFSHGEEVRLDQGSFTRCLQGTGRKTARVQKSRPGWDSGEPESKSPA